MDELDKKIISELQESYSLTPRVTEIAKKLGKSSTTVHSRIKRLERDGVVKGYSAKIDSEKSGKKLNAFYFIKTARGENKSHSQKIIGELLKNPYIKSVYSTMGEWDLMAEFVGCDSNDYMEFMRLLEPMEGITATKGKSILKTYDSHFKVLPE